MITMRYCRRWLCAVAAAAPVVVVTTAARAADARYWDADAYHYNNDFVTGAGMGGTGTWGDGNFSSVISSAPWWNGANYNAIFWGDAGIVTLDSLKTPAALTFKTDGYTLSGGSLQFQANQPNTIEVQGGVATIALPITTAQGYAPVKTGGGTLHLSGNLMGIGELKVTQGALSIEQSLNETFSGSGRIVLDGGTLRNTALTRTFLRHEHPITLGPAGGTFDIPTPGASLTYGGHMDAIGRTLTKTGAGTFNFSGSPSAMHSKLKVIGGIYQGLLARPTIGPAIADVVTLDGGTLFTHFGTEANQGLTVGPGGGTIQVSTGVGYSGPLAGSGILNIERWPGTQAPLGGHYAWMRGTGSTFTGPINVRNTDFLADDAGSASATAPITLDNARMGVSVYADLYAPLRPIIIAAGDAAFTNLRTLTVGGISGPGNLAKPHNAGTVLADHVRVQDLSIAAGIIAIKSSGGDGAVSHVNTIATPGGQLDLRDNALVIDAGTVAEIESLVASGRNGGAWDGSGIVTTEPAARQQLTTLAVATAADVLGLLPGQSSSWKGRSVDADDVLVAYTYAGDADMSGDIDGDDYFQIDANFSTGEATYFGGDFDHSGAINADDYFLIDINYSRQSAPAPARGVAAVPEPAGVMTLSATGSLIALRRRQRSRH